MKLKSLVKTFSYTELMKECEKQGWRLPTLAEARELETDHDEFWIQKQATIHNKYDELFYNKPRNRVGFMHKNHRLTTVVVVLPKLCSACEHLCAPRGCLLYDFTIPTDADQFGCSTGFKRSER